MSPSRDTPGVIAPPPLIYLGFILIGWGLTELAARPEVVAAIGADLSRWLTLGFGLETPVRRGIALALILIFGLGMAAVTILFATGGGGPRQHDEAVDLR